MSKKKENRKNANNGEIVITVTLPSYMGDMMPDLIKQIGSLFEDDYDGGEKDGTIEAVNKLLDKCQKVLDGAKELNTDHPNTCGCSTINTTTLNERIIRSLDKFDEVCQLFIETVGPYKELSKVVGPYMLTEIKKIIKEDSISDDRPEKDETTSNSEYMPDLDDMPDMDIPHEAVPKATPTEAETKKECFMVFEEKPTTKANESSEAAERANTNIG